MEIEDSLCPANAPQGASNYDEYLRQHSLIFADSLKDLKNIRKQVHSAAEYFELSYSKDTKKQLVMEALKDYVTKALISTVDHLGTLAFKVNNFLDEKIDEISGAEIRISCLEQKLRTYQKVVDCSGLSQQSLLIKTPKCHKHYIIPSADTKPATGAEYNPIQSKTEGVQAIPMEPSPTLFRMHFPESFSSTRTFSFAKVVPNKHQERRAASPHRFPLKRSGTLISCSSSPKTNEQYPLVPQRSASFSNYTQGDRTKQIQQYSKKSKPLFKALLSLRKKKKDGRNYI